MAEKNKERTGKFVEAVCTRCGNKQVLFGKSSSKVKCSKCGKLLVATGGGKSRIRTLIRKVFR